MTVGGTPISPVLLSICIPTYNFGAFIGETLESVLSQVVKGVEVVVLDGGSTDSTSDVVESFQQRFPSLRYERRDERGGIDRDLARTVDLARGEYCWLFCGDDLMKPGALARMMDNLSSGHDLYVCGFTLCTPDMRPFMESPIMRMTADAEFELGEEGGRRAYFELAQTTPAFFSFAGSLIFKKSRWDSISLDEAFVGSCWAHVARIFTLMPQGLRLKYLSDSYLYKRTENDSFMDRGIIRRYALAIEGYSRLANTFFGKQSSEARHIRRVLANEFPPWILLHAKMEGRKSGFDEDLPLLDGLAAAVYRDRNLRNWIYRVLYRYTPIATYKSALSGYRAVKSLLRARQSG